MRSLKSKRKSQSLVFEQVILFVMGITIFIIYFATFNVYQVYFLTAGANDQLSGVKSLVTTNIVKLTSLEENANASVIIDIPSHVGNEIYLVDLNEYGINVSGVVSGVSKESTILRLNDTYTFGGRVVSLEGKIMIIKKGKEIKII
ncbi:MAG: hypothetical protein ABIJ92_01325 [Candidatus Aenigmatarchaeota archaeon]